LLTKMSQCNERLGAISPELPPKDTTPILAQMVQRICSAERVNLFVRQSEEVASLTCFDEYSGRSIEIPLGQGFVGRCAEHKDATVVQHMLKDAHFNPNLDQRHGITIQDALYVPICSSAGYTSVVVEILNKMSGAFDKTDETIARMVGTHAHASIHRAHELQRLEEARTQALSLLTSVQYLYPYTGGTSDILHGAVAQLSIVMQVRRHSGMQQRSTEKSSEQIIREIRFYASGEGGSSCLRRQEVAWPLSIQACSLALVSSRKPGG